MRKYLSLILFSILFSIKSFATADDVYHERTLNSIGGTCGAFVNNLTPTSANTVTIGFRIANQGFTNQAKIYYTINGTNPSGSKGTASGTTMVLSAVYTCTFSDVNGTYDVVFATIPAYPTGTVVNYIVSAYSNFGLEIFGNGGTATSSGAATVFTYTVASVLPINMLSFNGKKENTGVKLTWVTSQEINTDRYEVFSSINGIDFKLLGIKKAAGNSNVAIEYTYIDMAPAKGNNFYKIKSIDKDAKFTYSKVIKINLDNKGLPSVTNYGRVLYINFNSAEKENYNIVLVNNLGQKITTWNIADNGTQSDYTLQIPLTIKESIYHVSIKGISKQFSRSVFVQ